MKRTLCFTLLFGLFAVTTQAQPNAWVNEIHYDNDGGDTGEFVEVVIENPSAYALSDFSVVFYNGNGGTSYESETLDAFTVGSASGDYTVYSTQVAGIQNGAPDGLALVHDGTVLQFLSYEGTFTAAGGPADGQTSTDIGVSETGSTPAGESLQLEGSGTTYADFTWTGPAAESPGAVNANQTLGSSGVITVDDDGGSDYTSIQAAVDNASAGQIVDVLPGTYEEQVVITTDDLIIRGAGSGTDPSSNTIIRSPESLSYAFNTGSNDNYPIVGVDGVTNSTLENLRIDGAGRGNGNDRFVGVGFWNAGGTVTNSVITGVRETPLGGMQHGVGIYADNDTGGPYAVNVTGTTVDDFQKNGMALHGAGLTVNVEGNTIAGAGVTGVIGQNGIQVGDGATGSIVQNDVSDLAFDGATYAAAGILVQLADGNTVVEGNTVERAQVGLWFYNSSAGVTGNSVASPATVGLGSWGAILDPVTSAHTPEPTPFGTSRDEATSFQKTSAAISYTFDENTLVGDDAESSTGLEIYSDSETVHVTGTGNLIRDFATGVFIGEGDEGLIESVVLNENCIVSNESAGLVNSAALIVDATDNWWGSAAGPGTGGANGVDGPVTADPFAADPVSGVEGCGGASQECLASAFTETVVSNEPPGVVEITIDDPEGIGQVRFYEVANFTIASADGDFTDQGDGTWTPSTPGDMETVFTLTQADTDNPDASYFAQITNGCGTLTDIDPPHGFNGTATTFALEGNYPNPFHTQTTIGFDLPEAVDVTLAVYDVMGRKVATLVDQFMAAGTHDVIWQGRDRSGEVLASGVYFVRLEAGDRIATQRLTLVR